MANANPTPQATASGRQVAIDIEELFSAYLSVCNRALEEMDEFWVRQASRLNRALGDGSNYRAEVYGDDPDDVIAEFTIAFDSDTRRFRLLPPGDHEVLLSRKVPLEYVRDVAVTRPDWYIEHPTRIDWRWVSTRFGSEIRHRIDGRGSWVAGGLLALGVVLAVLALSRRD